LIAFRLFEEGIFFIVLIFLSHKVFLVIVTLEFSSFFLLTYQYALVTLALMFQ